MSVNMIANRIMESLGMGQKKEGLSREQAFEARPMRNPELKWRVNDEDCVEVVIPRRSDRLGRVMGFVFAVPETKPVILDDVGTFVWGLCDAKHTVADLVEKAFGGSAQMLVMQALQEKQVPIKELNRIKKMLDELEGVGK